MIKYINSYYLSTARPNLPLAAWEWRLSDLQASSFPPKLTPGKLPDTAWRRKNKHYMYG